MQSTGPYSIYNTIGFSLINSKMNAACLNSSHLKNDLSIKSPPIHFRVHHPRPGGDRFQEQQMQM